MSSVRLPGKTPCGTNDSQRPIWAGSNWHRNNAALARREEATIIGWYGDEPASVAETSRDSDRADCSAATTTGFHLRLAFSERPAADALDGDVDVDALCARFW